MEGWLASQSGQEDNGNQPESRSVTVQKAAKASHMSECGQGLKQSEEKVTLLR